MSSNNYLDERWQDILVAIIESIIGIVFAIFAFSSDHTAEIYISILWEVFVIDRLLVKYENYNHNRRIEQTVNKIGKIIDLEANTDDQTFSFIETLFYRINSIFSPLKDKIISDTLKEFKSMDEQMKTKEIDSEDGFLISLPNIQQLTRGQEVLAITFLLREDGSAYNTNKWKSYLDTQINAAINRGVIVKRIFITKRSVLSKVAKLDWVQKHFSENRKETGLQGYFVDKDLFDNEETRLKNCINYGFLLINSKIAVLDNFFDLNDRPYDINSSKPPYKYKVSVTIVPEEINDLKWAFESLIDPNGPCKCVELSYDLLKEPQIS